MRQRSHLNHRERVAEVRDLNFWQYHIQVKPLPFPLSCRLSYRFDHWLVPDGGEGSSLLAPLAGCARLPGHPARRHVAAHAAPLPALARHRPTRLRRGGRFPPDRIKTLRALLALSMKFNFL